VPALVELKTQTQIEFLSERDRWTAGDEFQGAVSDGHGLGLGSNRGRAQQQRCYAQKRPVKARPWTTLSHDDFDAQTASQVFLILAARRQQLVEIVRSVP
jgi:hypothetical protein